MRPAREGEGTELLGQGSNRGLSQCSQKEEKEAETTELCETKQDQAKLLTVETRLQGSEDQKKLVEMLNQIARKQKLRGSQKDWNQPKPVASNLRKANKVRKQLEKEAFKT